MRCPTDETTLVMSERNGIEIDYCPQCRGVWLDRGELEGYAPPQQQGYGQQGYGQGYGQQPYRKKRENWLSELFD